MPLFRKASTGTVDTSSFVLKETGKALVAESEISKIHTLGADNQDLSSFVGATDPRLTDARPPTTHTHESTGGLTQSQILTRQL